MTERYRLLLGKCEDVLPTLESSSVDAICSDVPSGTGFLGAAWDRDKGGRLQWVAWLAGVMEEARRVIKPGGYALIWALPRTSHWAATAIEDAGWDIKDCLYHAFATGYPKSYNIDRERGTALKPSVECWWLARAPLSEPNIRANVERWGTGALNIGACRVPGSSTVRSNRAPIADGSTNRDFLPEYETGSDQGRWPSHLLLSCNDCDPQCAECPPRLLDRQNGITTSGQPRDDRGTGGIWSPSSGIPAGPQYGDSGGFSRFLVVCKPSRLERDAGLWDLPHKEAAELVHRVEGSAGMESPRAGAGRTSGGHNNHPTTKSLTLMRYLVRLITPPNGTVLDFCMGSGTTLAAAALEGLAGMGIEQDADFLELARHRIAYAENLATYGGEIAKPEERPGQLSLFEEMP